MYLKALSIHLYDARSGDLLAIGEWKDSTLHGFREYASGHPVLI